MARKLILHFVLPTAITILILYMALRGLDNGQWARMLDAILNLNPHAPNFALLMLQPWVLQLHIAAAVLAFLLGLIQIFGVKGKAAHRILGWIWGGLMLATAVSSFFIREINHGAFSFIHALSGWTVVVSPMVIYFARRHDIKRHRRTALGLFMGGLVVAGLFTLMPGRLMWRVFFG